MWRKTPLAERCRWGSGREYLVVAVVFVSLSLLLQVHLEVGTINAHFPASLTHRRSKGNYELEESHPSANCNLKLNDQTLLFDAAVIMMIEPILYEMKIMTGGVFFLKGAKVGPLHF
jgi:hypothetical protein